MPVSLIFFLFLPHPFSSPQRRAVAQREGATSHRRPRVDRWSRWSSSSSSPPPFNLCTRWEGQAPRRLAGIGSKGASALCGSSIPAACLIIKPLRRLRLIRAPNTRRRGGELQRVSPAARDARAATGEGRARQKARTSSAEGKNASLSGGVHA